MSDTSQPLDRPATRSTVEGNFQSYEGIAGRILDPVRAAALTASVEHCRHYDADEDVSAHEEAIEVAKAFEEYLAGDD